MKDILATALDDEHIEMIVWLLRLDKHLLNHKVSDGYSCKDRLIKQQWLTAPPEQERKR